MDNYDKIFIQKFLSKRIITPNGCWEFTGSIDNHGYGKISYANKLWKVHRLSLFLFALERFNKTLQACHKCNNRKCFNPDHLYSGTQTDNSRDTKNSGMARNQNSLKTHCKNGHEFTSENTYIKPSTRARRCITCQRSK